ncbi:dynein regulatory complex subunit 7 isoform X2 [Polypterus senegalus]|uniref:dynein regulatory complex subunit 7 isoform X2 n=1 Tax=Polypterus senegalus TaxID=55291 RepID=UPI001965204E|nr:dynein regulatory complex subunit 7 isoform X2 [Polypterus senegalus]
MNVPAEGVEVAGENNQPVSENKEETEDEVKVMESEEPLDDKETSEQVLELQELEEALSNIPPEPPSVQNKIIKHVLRLDEFPPSYKENTPKERSIFAMVENFRLQYAYLYPDRKPLILCPLNECKVQKSVCTTLRPTLLNYPETYSWDGCASFVSDYLIMEPLEPPTDPPKYLYSSSTVLRFQQGTCFDFAILLCSILLGAGYNAYCVSGYAVKELCLQDQSRQQCPHIGTRKQKSQSAKKTPKSKYSVKPPKNLNSSFERQQAENLAAEERKQEEAKKRELEQEQPPPDPLHGLRVHCWVLVLAGKREIPENFFIDPLTGLSFSTADERFLGVESLWNHRNYWINMQDCRNGCKDMTFDLDDNVKWECILPTADEERKEEVDEEGDHEEPRIFEMPSSWVRKIEISPKEIKLRCPGGRKVIKYKKAKLEKFSPYMMSDGLTMRLTTYQDIECTSVVEVREWFSHRQDHLEERKLKKETGVTTEYFKPGRTDALKSHRYLTMVPGAERQMDFYSQARTDGLASRVELSSEMKETFEDRPDFLHFQHVVFGKKEKHLVPVSGETNSKPILIIQRFHHNHEKAANDDIAEKAFLISDQRIQLTYHREVDQIIPPRKDFFRPFISGGKQEPKVNFSPNLMISFQVNSMEKPVKNLLLYELLTNLLEDEIRAKNHVKMSENEVQSILALRSQEELESKLTISVYDTDRNERALMHRQDLEHAKQEERLHSAEKELDFLAPFLIQLGDPKNINFKMAQQLKEDCLSDLKRRLIDKANLIQARFEKETQELLKKQQWYQQNQMTMTKEDEDSYLSYCSEAMFRIHILELRLNRHKEQAPKKYLALEEKLRMDPRLAEYLSK